MAELSIEKATLGISHITMMSDGNYRIATVTHPDFGTHIGRGVSEAEAIDNAFENIRSALAASFR